MQVMIAFVLLLLSACGTAQVATTPEPEVTPSSTPSLEPLIEYTADKTYSAPEKEKLDKAAILVNQLIRSECFADFYITKRSQLVQTGGRTREQVVDHIRGLRLTIPVTMYYSSKNVVGYRQPPSPKIHTNRRYHRNYSPCSVASNIGHEMLHSAGYGHDFNATARRPYSVPYSFNAMANACCEDL